ncbi:MAG: type II toxin-antitoxin system Phd/YefM family antitoxin [Candidatus Binatia bacterium]
MSSTYSVTQAQSQLSRFVRKAEEGEPVHIQRRAETVAVLLSRERMEAIVETMEILANPDAMKALIRHRAGRLKLFPLSAREAVSAAVAHAPQAIVKNETIPSQRPRSARILVPVYAR